MPERLCGHEGCGGGVASFATARLIWRSWTRNPMASGPRTPTAPGSAASSGPVNTGPVPVEMPQRTKVSDGV